MIIKKPTNKNDIAANFILIKIKSFIFILLFLIFFTDLFLKSHNLIIINKYGKEDISPDITKKSIISKNNAFNMDKSDKINISSQKCYQPSDNSNIKIIHLIITRFILEYWSPHNFPKRIYNKDYILNGIRVMKKYLFPSLENQSCKEFIWILLLGDKANKTFIESLFNFNISFEYRVVYNKTIKSYVRNITKGFDVLISTRIDYDDRIYYDAINDVRKAINFYKPMILYGYNRGVHYYESDGKYYDFYSNYNNEGVMSIFISLIININQVNDTYIVYDIGRHPVIKKSLLEKYKSFGIKELNYEPAIFDSGDPKFVWVRQNYSGLYIYSNRIKKRLKAYNFNLTKFYGK